jgi:hypothetical protein
VTKLVRKAIVKQDGLENVDVVVLVDCDWA